MFVALLVLVSCLKTKEDVAYDLSIVSGRILLNGTATSQSDMLKRVRRDVKQNGFMIAVRITTAPEEAYGDMVSLLRPISDCSLSDYKFSVSQRPPIKITGWTCPMTFAVAKEETLTVDGTNILTTAGATTIEQLASYLSQTKSTNKNFRIYINAYPHTSAEEFYNVVSIA